MKIGINVNCYLRDSFSDEELLCGLSNIGYDSVDYDLFDYVDSQIPAMERVQKVLFESEERVIDYYSAFRKKADKVGISVSQTHAVFAVDDLPEHCFSDNMIWILKKSILATSILGAKFMVIHGIMSPYDSDYEICFEKTVELGKKLYGTLKKYGITLCFENLFEHGVNNSRCMSTFSYGFQLKALVDRLGEGYGVCLDTGHTRIVKADLYETVRLLGNRIKVIHAHDNDGVQDRHMLPGFGVGHNAIKWRNFVSVLKELGYNGVFSLELDGAMKRSGTLNRDFMLDYARLGYIIAQCALEEEKL